MGTFKIVIDIVKEDQQWKCCHKTNISWWDQIIEYFKNSFGITFSLIQMWPTRKK